MTQDPAAPADPADDSALTSLDPRFKGLMRLQAALVALPVLIASIVAVIAVPMLRPAIIAVVVVAIALVLLVPHRRFAARGYAMSRDRLRVVRGLLFRSDTVVPFGRVQHLDVDRGPIERAFGLATLTLHTAGTHNASIRLPGLAHDRALAMREDIRSHIKRDSM